MYIYKFTHTDTGRSYIGQTVQHPNNRRSEHIARSRNAPRTYHFHNALNKYGIDAFSFEVLAEATTIDELNLLEEMYINQFDSIQNGFNIRKGGNNKLHSQESIERMKVSQLNAHARRRENGTDGGWKRKDGGPMLGKSHPKKGKPSKKWSDEAKARLSIIAKEREARKKLEKQGSI